MELQDLAFHRKVADGYLHLAGAYPGRFAVVDAAADADAVHQQVVAAILPRLTKA
jgi:thymidylate kinase